MAKALPKKNTEDTTKPTTTEATPAPVASVEPPPVTLTTAQVEPVKAAAPMPEVAPTVEAVTAPAAPVASTANPFEGLPAELVEALMDADILESAQQFSQQQRVSVNLRRLEVVQSNSGTHTGMVNGMPTLGQIAITAREGDPEYRRSMKLLLIDPLYFTPQNVPLDLKDTPEWANATKRDKDIVGARMMWKYDANGARNVTAGEAPVCSSSNGLYPWSRHLGTVVVDPRYPMPEGMPPVQHKIGYIFDQGIQDYKPVKNPCLTCPFAAWLKDDEVTDQKLKKPMCTATPTFIVYSVEDNEMFILKGTNATQAAALQGARAKAFGSKYNGEALPGLMSFFSVSGYYNRETGQRFNSLREMQLQLSKLPTVEARNNYFRQFTPVYPNRPEGQPSKDHPYVPVHPVMLSITKATHNGYNQPMIPQFTLLDGSTEKVDGPFLTDKNADWIEAGAYTLTPLELGNFLQTLREYTIEGYREALMGMQSSATTDFLQPALNAPAPAVALPASAVPGQFAAPPSEIDLNATFN